MRHVAQDGEHQHARDQAGQRVDDAGDDGVPGNNNLKDAQHSQCPHL